MVRNTLSVLVALSALTFLVAAAGFVYLLGEQGCPPPPWAFWRDVDAADLTATVRTDVPGPRDRCR